MSIMNLIMEQAMTPAIDDNFYAMMAMESDTDCFDQLRAACGAPKYEAPEHRVRMMSATEALNQLAEHGRIADSLETKKQRVDYSAAFEAINRTLDTTINPEMRDEMMTAKRNEALGFYDALEAFMNDSEEEPAMEGAWTSFMEKGAGRAYQTADYEENYQPRGRKNLKDFQLFVVDSDAKMNEYHKTYPHIFFKRGFIIRGMRKLGEKIGDKNMHDTHELFWIDPGTTGDTKDAVCVATATLNAKCHLIFDISVRSEFQRYGLMSQILDFVVREYKCNEATTEGTAESTERDQITENALTKAGFVNLGSDEYQTFWRKGNPLPGSCFKITEK